MALPFQSPRARFAALLSVGVMFGAATASAQALPGIDEYARAIAEMTARRWAGQRVDPPLERERPASPTRSRAVDAPLAIHAAEGVDDAIVEAAMRGARRMIEALRSRGFDALRGDGDLGGGPELDLYLVDADLPYAVASDGRASYLFLDGIVDHVLLDDSLRGERLEACASEAVASALLAQLDPAEAESMRRAMATTLLWMEIGRFDGCTDDVALAQTRPSRGFLEPGDAGAALFLALLERRSDDGSGRFLRETWTMARQRTWEGSGLRGSPDLIEAIATSASLVDSSLDRLLVDYASRRFALGAAPRDRSALFAGFPRLPDDFTVPFAFEARTDAMPVRTAPHVPAIAPTGSAYAHVAVTTPTDARLRIFHRGETHTRWSLVAIGVDADGREKARVEAPIRDREGDAYLVVELGGIHDVYVIATNLGLARADADEASGSDRTFHLLFDLARD